VAGFSIQPLQEAYGKYGSITPIYDVFIYHRIQFRMNSRIAKEMQNTHFTNDSCQNESVEAFVCLYNELGYISASMMKGER
jgi:hypothetical protein